MERLLTIFLLFLFLQACKSTDEVDLIVHNANIYTVDSSLTKIEAFAVKDGRFVKFGTSQEILKTCTAKQVVDAQQRSIFPGFYDAHSHFSSLGKLALQADLSKVSSFQEILTLLKVHRRKHPNQGWLFGKGWDQNLWKNRQFPSKDSLDLAFPDIPVMLERIDEHSVLVNQKALEMAGISTQTKVEGGLVEVKNGKLTGILLDNAVDLVRSVLPKPSLAEQKEMLMYAQNLCFTKGLTSVCDAGVDKELVELIDLMHKNNELKIRIYAMLNPTKENLDHYLQKGIYKTDRLNVRSFKVFTDGALGSRGALLLKPYEDSPQNYGILRTSITEMQSIFELADQAGFQVGTHCIGDSANRLVLDLYGQNLKGKNDKRWRIEHCQIVDSADIPKFGKFSIIPSVQPTHCTSDMLWAETRIGKKRLKNAYPFKYLFQQNQLIAFGTDFPVEDANPMYSFHAAIARQNFMHEPEEGFQMENAIDPINSLKAMTIWAAYANFEEKERGSIEIGKMADFVILDTDITDTHPRLLRLTRILNTFVAGEKVYSNYEAGY